MSDIKVDGFEVYVGDKLAIPAHCERKVICERDNIYYASPNKIGFALPGGTRKKGNHTRDMQDPALVNFLAHIELVKNTERYTCKFVNPHSKEV